MCFRGFTFSPADESDKHLDLIRPLQQVWDDAARPGQVHHDDVESVVEAVRSDGHSYEVADVGSSPKLPYVSHILQG